MLVFVAITIFAVIILIGSFVFGHDHDISHDVGHEVDTDGSISIFSTKVIMTFVLGFGAAGTIASYYHIGPVLSSLIGLVAGAVLALLMFAMLNMIYKQQSSSVITLKSLIGCTGTLTVGIDGTSAGEIGISNPQGQYSNYLAVSKDGSSIPKNAPVKVSATLGDKLQVEKCN